MREHAELGGGEVALALAQRLAAAAGGAGQDALYLLRGLRAILEDVMLDVMFDIPSRDDVVACHVAAATIRKEAPPELVYGKPKKRRALKEPAASKKKPRTA